MTAEVYATTVQAAIQETADAFSLVVASGDGSLSVPCSYQRLEPGFRPFRAGKAAPGELQAELDATLEAAASQGVDLGIDSEAGLRKLAIQLGLGIDCSNFAYRALSRAHAALGLGSYGATVFRETKDIRALHQTKRSWQPRDAAGHPRTLTLEERTMLGSAPIISVDNITAIYGKDHPVFIAGSEHLADENASVAVESHQALPGDLLTFYRPDTGAITHVGVVDTVNQHSGPGDFATIDFWHSWHSRDFGGGVRRDWALLAGSDFIQWSHPGLGDERRYADYALRRPRALALLSASLEHIAGKPPKEYPEDLAGSNETTPLEGV